MPRQISKSNKTDIHAQYTFELHCAPGLPSCVQMMTRWSWLHEAIIVLGRPIDGAQATSRTQSEWPSNFSSSSKPPDPSVFSRQIWCDKWATSKQVGLSWLCGWNHQWCKLRGWLLLNDWAATCQLQTRFYSMSRQKSETKEHENTINSSLSSTHYIGI